MKILSKEIITDQNPAKFIYKEIDIDGGESKFEFEIKSLDIPNDVKNIIEEFFKKLILVVLSGNGDPAHAYKEIDEVVSKIENYKVKLAKEKKLKMEAMESNSGIAKLIIPSIESFFYKFIKIKKAEYLQDSSISNGNGLSVKREKEEIKKRFKKVENFINNYDGELKNLLSGFYLRIKEENSQLNEENVINLKNILDNIKDINENDFLGTNSRNLLKGGELEFANKIYELFKSMVDNTKDFLPDSNNKIN